jgi:3-oxoacyl-[acyl-carrier protein] reductase
MAAMGGGAVVNISSVGGMTAQADMIGYGTSKAALNQLTRTSAAALAPLGIRVNAIAPGIVATPRTETISPQLRARITAGIPLGREALPEEIAGVARFLLSSEASYITGEVVVASGGGH